MKKVAISNFISFDSQEDSTLTVKIWWASANPLLRNCSKTGVHKLMTMSVHVGLNSYAILSKAWGAITFVSRPYHSEWRHSNCYSCPEIDPLYCYFITCHINFNCKGFWYWMAWFVMSVNYLIFTIEVRFDDRFNTWFNRMNQHWKSQKNTRTQISNPTLYLRKGNLEMHDTPQLSPS